MEVHDSLPYIDSDISSVQRDAALKLIQRELPKEYSTTLHQSIAELPASRLTPALQKVVNQAGSGTPLTGGIDVSRYESFAELSPASNVEEMNSALRAAYTNITHLRGRQTNISLLEEHGKNAWLIGNAHSDDIYKALQNELEATKAQSDHVNKLRRAAQEDSKGELLGLQETWKEGIGRIIDTQLATDGLRQEILQKRKS